MNNAELDALIDKLMNALYRAGFDWVAADAIQNLPRTDSSVSRALALLNAIESVTVDLASAEKAMLSTLGVEAVYFQPSHDDDSDEFTDDWIDDAVIETEDDFVEEIELNRSEMFNELLALRSVFTELRTHIDDKGN